MPQVRIGWRPGTAGTAGAAAAVSTLMESLYGVWNGDTTTNELGTQIYGAWNGDNSANDSVGTNHGSLMNGCTFSIGKIGQAFTFDGINDYVSLPNNSLNFTGDFSIGLWVYFNTEQSKLTMGSTIHFFQ